MADKTIPVRKKPVSQKRVAVVLASLVGTMTISAGVLLLMEGGALGTNVPGAFVAESAQVAPDANLQGKAWNYIIIYESADLSARADSLAEGVVTGGSDPHRIVRPKANFHFVIDSSSSWNDESKDGLRQVGTSWYQQEPGAPYASWPDVRSHSFTPYTNAVGICIASDINRGHNVSEAQRRTLIEVVQKLQKSYNIPRENVLFQWDRRLDAQGARPATPSQLAFEAQIRSLLD